MTRSLCLRCSALLLMWAISTPSDAVIEIEITKGVVRPATIAVVPFSWRFDPGEQKVDVARVVNEDLSMTGRFQGLGPALIADFGLSSVTPEEIQAEAWRQLDVDYVIIGSIGLAGSQPYIEFRLFDVVRRSTSAPDRALQLLGQRVQVSATGLRRAAHKVSDLIYERITGEPGIFSTRLAYITQVSRQDQYILNISDLDGSNPVYAVRSPRPLMSPTWSEDGRRIAFVSFENDRAEVYSMEVATGDLTLVARYPGVNGAPAFSPDGRNLALALSRGTGNIDIHMLELASGTLTRLTDSLAIDTEPAWAPDGRSLYFTSDRSGGPQIYRVAASGGRAERVTFEGNYNGRPRVSSDGTKLAMVHRQGQDYRIAVQDLRTGTLRVVTSGSLDESPSFSPSGHWIAYAAGASSGGAQRLTVVRSDGGTSFTIGQTGIDVREPAWAPAAAAHGSSSGAN